MLAETPELEAKMLFEHLLADRPGVVDGRALRTFQRRVTHWRCRHGPPKEVGDPKGVMCGDPKGVRRPEGGHVLTLDKP
jgi:hypothetical protein